MIIDLDALLAALALVVAVAPGAAREGGAPGGLSLELDALSDEGGACRLTFLARNGMGRDVERAVFETVIFTPDGAVERLTLFDFRDLPAGRPRVRQFDLAGLACDAVGRVLVNGAQTCEGVPEGACMEGLALGSRVDAELLG